MWDPDPKKLIKVRLQPPGEDIEAVWAEDLGAVKGRRGARRVRLANIPIAYSKPTYGDAILVVPDNDDGVLAWDGAPPAIIDDGGRWVVSIEYWLADGFDDAEAAFQALVRAGEKADIAVEGVDGPLDGEPGMASLAVPGAMDLAAVLGTLRKAKLPLDFVAESDDQTVSFVVGHLFEVDVVALVNAVNCVGVMGKGLALEVKKKHPEVFRAYAAACSAGKVVPGKMHVVARKGVGLPRYVINFPTKRHWREKSRLEDIEAGLDDLVAVVKRRRITSIAVPALGCGLGGLDWANVRPLMKEKLGRLDGVRVLVFEPQ